MAFRETRGQTEDEAANGNITSDGTHSYAWGGRNQLVSMNFGANAFQYDPFGRRVGKTSSGATTNFLYDGVNSVQEIASGTPTANLTMGGIDEVFTRTDSGGTRNFLADALGSTLALSDSTGTIQTQYTYEPFGNTTTGGLGSTNPFQYTGRENDGTGLYYYRARYYSPTLQRFTAEDLARFRGGFNLYRYAFDSPVNLNDPLGLWTVSLGVNVNVQLGPINFQVSGGIAVDSSGNIGLFDAGGGGLGVGANVSGGLNLSGSNAHTICGLGGPFVNVSGNAGAGLEGSVNGFTGFDRQRRPVVGGGLTVGAGAGGGVSDAITITNVIPIAGRKDKCQ